MPLGGRKSGLNHPATAPGNDALLHLREVNDGDTPEDWAVDAELRTLHDD